MRIPQRPPVTQPLWNLDKETIQRILSIPNTHLVGGQYLHWDKLRHRPPPPGVSHEDWWAALKLHRRGMYRQVSLSDKAGEQFQFAMVDPIPEQIHRIDLAIGGLIQMPDQIANPETKDQYYVSSLIDEAITSSQLEGATTTRAIAREMIRTGREPRDKSERMILNNYLAMRRIGVLRNQPLTKELVFELHRTVTEKTLDVPDAAGRFRTDDEQVRVEGMEGEVYHSPPCADSLPTRMQWMCDFANGGADSDAPFLHPVLRSIILHFWLAYDHPFVDGNGRTARALFYWSMLRHKYWLSEFIAISQVIRKSAVASEVDPMRWTKNGLVFAMGW